MLNYYLSQFIPVEFMENVLTPIQHGANTAICWVGAWILFRHSDGMRMRKVYGFALLTWGVAEVVFMVQQFVWHMPVFQFGNEALSAFKMLAGNILGWLLLLYPTEALRPHWLNWKRAVIQLLPMVVFVVLDYALLVDLSLLIAAYPALLFVLVLTHLRAYRIWCEENYSSMDSIDVQWIVRYLFMLLVVGLSYLYMMVSDSPTRAFTQNMLLFFVFVYSTEQILYRKDPWGNVQGDEVQGDDAQGTGKIEELQAASPKSVVEQWMEQEKPYLNPDFQLMDLRRVLPMNRSYLSKFIHDEYGCSFYQFVTRYRLEEAKRLLRDQPDLTVAEVATRSGFSNRIVFSRTFSKEMGISPREWSLQCNHS
jgi:AraC-like DNA-binding protein